MSKRLSIPHWTTILLLLVAGLVAIALWEPSLTPPTPDVPTELSQAAPSVDPTREASLRIGGARDWVPITWFDEHGAPRGRGYELAKRVAAKLSLSPVFYPDTP